MPEIQLPNSRRYSDVHFRVWIDDNGVPISWDSVTVKKLFMYSEKQRGFGGKCSFQVDEDPHYLNCTFHAYNQQFLGIHRVVIQIELEGNVNTYDARVTNMVASTSNEPVIYDGVIDVPIHVSMVDTTVLYELLAACRQATFEATDAAERADGVYERMSGGGKDEVLTKLSNSPLDIGWKPVQGGGGSHPYVSLERLRRYLYRVTFDSLPEDNGFEGLLVGGCSSFVQGGKLYRNLDFNFDNAASFIVRTRDFEGMSFLSGLNDGAMDDELVAELPYRVVDGRNNNGIMVSTHVLFNDWNWTGSGARSASLTRLPFLVLSRVKSMTTIAADLADVLGNLYASEALQATGYLLQVLVTDGTTTYAILPPTSAGQAYVLQDITANPKLANFRWVNRGTVSRSDADLQDRPTGIERFNAMPCDLSALRFTKAYEVADRLSEFIGIDDTTKVSTDAELMAIYNLARAEYLDRQRDGKTWQTMHSVVYGDKMEHLYIQEDWSDDIVVAGVSKEYVDGEISRLEAEIPDADEFATKDELAAVEEEIPDIAPLTQRVVSAEGGIVDINGKIPAQASAVNKLADQAFVNSSVQTAAANFRGNWGTKSAVPTDYTLYPADYAGNKKPSTNDYLVIQADESQDGGTWRYKYTGDWDTDGINGWNAEYEVNETPLTAAQLAALNSGVTAAAVVQIETNRQAILGKQDALSPEQLAAVNSGVTSEDVAQIEANRKAIEDNEEIVSEALNNLNGRQTASEGKLTELEREVANKANKDGYYQTLTAGYADKAADLDIHTATMVHHTQVKPMDTTGGDKDVKDGNGYIRVVRGTESGITAAGAKIISLGFNLIPSGSGTTFTFRCVKGEWGAYGTTEKNNGYLFANSQGQILIPVSVKQNGVDVPTHADHGKTYYLPPQDGQCTVVFATSQTNPCVHLCWSNGRDEKDNYEAYNASQVDLASAITAIGGTLRRVGYVFDEINLETKQSIRRIGYRLLNALSWTMEAGPTPEEGEANNTFRAIVSGGVASTDAIKAGGAFATKGVSGLTFSLDGTSLVCDSTIASVADFVTSLGSSTIEYELAVLVVATNTLNGQITISDYGIIIFENTAGATVVDIDFDFDTKWIDFVKNLPNDLEQITGGIERAHEDIDALRANRDNLGDVHAKSIDLDELPKVCHYEAIIKATTAPNVAPDFIGQMWIDTAAGKVYVATATTNSSSFKALN